MARFRRRERLVELLLPQLDELLNVVVVQIHGTHGTVQQERLGEGEYCRSRPGGDLTIFILRFRFWVVKTLAHCLVKMVRDQVRRAAKNIDPHGLRRYIGGLVRVFDEFRCLAGRA